MGPEDMKKVAGDLSELQTGVDTLFLLVCGLFVLFMQAGFAFLEAGSVRAKNTTNIILKNVMDVWIAALTYWLVGYPFAYGEPGNAFIGHNFFAASNIKNNFDGINTTHNDLHTADYYHANWFFQFVFAATASTIVSGAMAERTEFRGYLAYCTCLTAFVYPVVSHWAWASSGWLATGAGTGLAFKDFAGSAVVHITGGSAAFAGAVMLGPRIGRFDHKGQPQDIAGHSVPIAALGAFILFVGFLAFNGGSQLSISGPGDGATVALAFQNTIIGGSSSAMVAILVFKVRNIIRGKEHFWSLLITINAGLTGMVSMCASCNDLRPWSACVIGIVAGLAFLFWHYIMLKMRIDDPLDAVAVHFGGGMTGILLGPIFAVHGQVDSDGNHVGGIIYGGHSLAFKGFGWNMLGALTIMAWTAGLSFLLFGITKAFGKLRVPADIEIRGLDIPKHNEPAYPVASYEGFLPNISDTKCCLHYSECEQKKTKSSSGENDNVEVNGTDNNGYNGDAV